jgi:hypothetical protein
MVARGGFMGMRTTRLIGWILSLAMASLVAGCAHKTAEEPPKESFWKISTPR